MSRFQFFGSIEFCAFEKCKKNDHKRASLFIDTILDLRFTRLDRFLVNDIKANARKVRFATETKFSPRLSNDFYFQDSFLLVNMYKKFMIYTGVLGSFRRVGDAGDFSLFSGSVWERKQKRKRTLVRTRCNTRQILFNLNLHFESLFQASILTSRTILV